MTQNEVLDSLQLCRIMGLRLLETTDQWFHYIYLFSCTYLAYRWQPNMEDWRPWRWRCQKYDPFGFLHLSLVMLRPNK